jgi:hypothetical protein
MTYFWQFQLFDACDIFEKLTLEPSGEMAEWLKAHAWKACIPQGIQGSNPCLSAITFTVIQNSINHSL